MHEEKCSTYFNNEHFWIYFREKWRSLQQFWPSALFDSTQPRILFTILWWEPAIYLPSCHNLLMGKIFLCRFQHLSTGVYGKPFGFEVVGGVQLLSLPGFKNSKKKQTSGAAC